MLSRLGIGLGQRAVIAEAEKKYGCDMQLIVAMEELAELIQAVSKYKRSGVITANITEEIADVLICIEYIMDACEVSDSDVIRTIMAKIDRLKIRMEKEN